MTSASSPYLSRLPFACLAAALLGACSAGSGQEPQSIGKAAPSEVDRIGYAVSPCRGFCPAYSFVIAKDGDALFVGERNTSTTGHAAADGDPMLFERIRDTVARIRPTGPKQTISHDVCSTYATDQQTVTVTWMRGGESIGTLSYDLGCHDARFQEVRATLAATRKLLPINQLVGRATEF